MKNSPLLIIAPSFGKILLAAKVAPPSFNITAPAIFENILPAGFSISPKLLIVPLLVNDCVLLIEPSLLIVPSFTIVPLLLKIP